MKASEAREIAYKVREVKWTYDEIMNGIQAEAEKGNLHVVLHGFLSESLQSRLDRDGYGVKDLKSSDHLLFQISWGH
jgi:hypothetical protein